jgi:hypothetical protein
MFCPVCDEEHSQCPSCKDPICSDCNVIADGERSGECFSCNDPDLTNREMPSWIQQHGMKQRWAKGSKAKGKQTEEKYKPEEWEIHPQFR